MGLARRSIRSAAWNVAVNPFRIGVLFARSVILARLLPIEVFGVYALASSIVSLTAVLPRFGMEGAFLYRGPASEREEDVARTHFTLTILMTSVWTLLLVAGTAMFAEGDVRKALMLITGTTTVLQLTRTPQLILQRRVLHRRLALVNLVTAVLSTLLAVGLAWSGETLWAILAVDVTTAVVSVVAYYLWRPVWRPRLFWSPATNRYFLDLGGRSLLAAMLSQALERIDNLWTSAYLGNLALGFYSRAYQFATYPRLLLAGPISAVAPGAYAEATKDRQRLSRAFFRTNSFLVRAGFLLAGLLTLLAPEFIEVILGERWLPMLDAFRLMLVFTLLDPIKSTVSKLFLAVGKPEKVIPARLVQLSVLVAGLFVFGSAWSITGVAIAVDAMLVTGIALLLRQARAYVDFSLSQLFLGPSLAVGGGLLLGAIVTGMVPIENVLVVVFVKSLLFVFAYGSILLAIERQKLLEMVPYLTQFLTREIPSESGGS